MSEANSQKQPAEQNIDQKPERKAILTTKERAKLLNRRASFDYTKYNLDKENFHYHWANSSGANGSNIELYEKVGYDICKFKGEPITRKGQVIGVTQYLMRIPLEIHKEIQQHKLDEVKEIERSIGKKDIRGLPEGHIYGEVKTTSEIIR